MVDFRKNRLFDILQTHRFWLLDLLPSTVWPFFVLGSPMYGFVSMTAPEINLETQEIAPLNSMWKRTVYTGGGCGPITLSRGARYNDDTFYDWVKRAMRGFDKVHRTLLMIHFTGMDMAELGDGLNTDMGALSTGPTESWDAVTWVPGRVWILWDCLPTRYKAGSDFDANSAEASIMEIELQPHAVEEIVLGPSRSDMMGPAILGAVALGKTIEKKISGG